MGAFVRYLLDGEICCGLIRGSGQGLLVQTEGNEGLISLAEVELLPPVMPGKVIGIGPNYRAVGKEPPAEPSFFFKPPSTVIGCGASINLPADCGRVAVEPELALVIGRRARNIDVGAASDYIAGYTCANDVTALDRLTPNFNVGKSFDSFTPLGPWLVSSLPLAKLTSRLLVNGQEMITTSLDQLIFRPETLIAYLSSIMTLEPGDVILTGAPVNFSPVKPGDLITVEIAGIGTLTNRAC